MLDHSIFKNIPSGKTKYEKIRLYEWACKKYGLTPCFFRLKDIDLKHKKVRAYVKTGKSYRIVTMPIPKVIHNRAMPFSRASRRKIRLMTKMGYRIFNRSTRYGKLKIYKLLKKNPELRPHLPETALATPKNIARFMAKYRSIIIKPNNSSIGIGIMKLEKTGRSWTLHYPKKRLGSHWGKIRFTRQLPALLLKKIKSKRYLVQRTIPLATVAGRPFDLRVSVQRDGSGEWQITGIAGKLAAKNMFLTNVAQGGRIRRLPALLRSYPELDRERVIANIEKLSLQVATTLGQSIPGLADIGLDIGIDPHGMPFFIECNARDLRISFQKGRMYEQWRRAYENPVAYARYLLRPNPIQLSAHGSALKIFTQPGIHPAWASDGSSPLDRTEQNYTGDL